MTRIFERQVAGPSARAFVVGVGAYPSAKKALAKADTPIPLRNVPDLQSAATGAALFVDWLVTQADSLAAPLASIDLLLNVTVGLQTISSYQWSNRLSPPPGAHDPRLDDKVDAPTTANVNATGIKWKTDLAASDGSVAIFYICGHGAVLGNDNIVFLSDLNADSANPWGALLNVQTHASAFKVVPSISSAFFFVDACAELVTEIAFQNPGVGAQFATSNGRLGPEKVTVIAAAVPKLLAYEGSTPDRPDVVVGRFTQCLLQGLSGAAARQFSQTGGWFVTGSWLYNTLAPLYALRSDWADRPFEPSPVMLPAKPSQIVRFAAPKIPIQVCFDPKRDHPWSLELRDQQNAIIDQRASGPAVDWLTAAPASLFPYRLHGSSAQESKSLVVATPLTDAYFL